MSEQNTNPGAAVINEVAKGGHELKHAETVDKSAPQIPQDVHVKTVDRKPFLEEVTKPHELSHVDGTADRSAPNIHLIYHKVIEPDVHVKEGGHKALLAEVAAKTQEKA